MCVCVLSSYPARWARTFLQRIRATTPWPTLIFSRNLNAFPLSTLLLEFSFSSSSLLSSLLASSTWITKGSAPEPPPSLTSIFHHPQLLLLLPLLLLFLLLPLARFSFWAQRVMPVMSLMGIGFGMRLTPFTIPLTVPSWIKVFAAPRMAGLTLSTLSGDGSPKIATCPGSNQPRFFLICCFSSLILDFVLVGWCWILLKKWGQKKRKDWFWFGSCCFWTQNDFGFLSRSWLLWDHHRPFTILTCLAEFDKLFLMNYPFFFFINFDFLLLFNFVWRKHLFFCF